MLSTESRNFINLLITQFDFLLINAVYIDCPIKFKVNFIQQGDNFFHAILF